MQRDENVFAARAKEMEERQRILAQRPMPSSPLTLRIKFEQAYCVHASLRR
jgi:hypothetical protein